MSHGDLMNWNWREPALWQRLIAALLIVIGASALRAGFFGDLGRGIPYLTYYPAVMLAALYGGLTGGILATGLSALLSYYWIHNGLFSPVEKLALVVFLLSCTMISFICEEMRRAHAKARQAQKKAEEANQAKSVFLANMSHELRTPLNAILGFSSLMKEDDDIAEDHRQTLDLINRSGEHLLALINDVLDMAKIEAGHVTVEISPVDLSEMLRDITLLLRERAAAKGLQLTLDQSSSFPRFVRTDGIKLRQTIINLLGNAIKFTERGDVTMRLKSRPTKDQNKLLLIVEVVDTGVGIPTEDQERIFEAFVQVSQGNAQKGTGLGLAITRKFVESLGGRIAVDSKPGQGSTFRVELPVERADEFDLSKVRIKQGRIIGLAQGQESRRILIVEDQMENWLLLRRLLERVGFTVKVAEDGADGVATYHAWRPHFIWMDIRMKGMDGLEATRRIRSMEGGRDVKIVALTASVFKEERAKIMAAGMDDFIRKPYQPDEIFECLARHLGIKFVYQELSKGPAKDAVGELRPEAFYDLSPELFKEFSSALVNLDIPRIDGAIQLISSENPTLGEVLARRARQFAFGSILQVMQSAGDSEKRKKQ